MSFIYETHLHTDESSICGVTKARDYIHYYIDHGYTGIIVTDHFTGSESYVPDPKDPWEKQVDQYCRGYEEALDEGIKCGLDVFFGIEQCFKRDEVLIYGVDKEWLYKHPDIATWSRAETFRQVDLAGGAVVHAHPFRVRGYVKIITLNSNVHAIEAFNACDNPIDDVYNYAFARHYGLPVTAGSDMHKVNVKPDTLYGVRSEKRWTSVMDYVDALRGRTTLDLIYAQDHKIGAPAVLERPYEYLNANDTPVAWDVSCIEGDIVQG